jgi:hypothetical protein
MRTRVLGAQAKLCVANRRVGLATAAIAILPIAFLSCVPALRSQLTLNLFASLPVLQVAFVIFILAGAGLVPLEIYIGVCLNRREAISSSSALAGTGWVESYLVPKPKPHWTKGG